jgi:hypothetical protein
MTAIEPTPELLDQLVEQLVLVENLHDPRLTSGTLTTPYLVALSLRDEGIQPSEELVEHVLELVASRRNGQDAA